MANNRMYLVHRPSGKSIMLGKRMGAGWYQAPTRERMEEFFDGAEAHWHASGWDASQDDFMLVMEDNEGAPMCGTFDRYGESGPEKFRPPKKE